MASRRARVRRSALEALRVGGRSPAPTSRWGSRCGRPGGLCNRCYGSQPKDDTVTKETLETLPLDRARLDGGTQGRVKIDETTVAEYAEALAEGAKFPPLVVYFDGTDYWLADGFHRWLARQKAGLTEVEVEVRQGTRRDAVLHACGANESHGLRRSNEDKRKAVRTLLEDEEWSRWSDREIARACATTHPFVAKMRAALTGNVSSEEGSETSKGGEVAGRQYTTRHGTTATMRTENIGAKPKADPDP